MVADFNRINQLLCVPFFALFRESCFGFVAYFNQVQGMRILRHHEVTEMAAQSCDENMGIKTFFHNLVERCQNAWNIIFLRQISDFQILVVIQNIENFRCFFECDIFLLKCT